MILGIALAAMAAGQHISREPGHNPKWVKVAVVCFASGEQTSGMNKICYYNCLGSQAAITIPATALCPLNTDR